MPSSRCEKHRSRAAPQRRFRGARLCRSPCADTRGHTGAARDADKQRAARALRGGCGRRHHPPGPALPASFPGRPGSEKRGKRGPQRPAAPAPSRGPHHPPGAVPARSRPHASPPAFPPAPLGPAQTARGTAPPLERLQAAPRAQQPPPPSRGCRFRGGAATGNGVWRRVADHCSCGYWKLLAFEYVCVEDANGAINTAVTWIKALIKRSEFIDSAYVPFLQFANGTVKGSPPPDRARSAMAARVQLAAKTRQGLSSPFNWQRRLPYKKQHR